MKKALKFLFLILWSIDGFSQSGSREYLVITIEETYKISQHGVQTYFWIAPADSVNSYETKLSRLYLASFSQANLIDCCGGKPIDPFLVSENANLKMDDEYLSVLKSLGELVLKNRKKLQTISKKWESGQQQTIRIFATPIEGEFCYSDFHPIGQQRTGYRGKVYLPRSSFKHSEKFWKSSKAEFILRQDFSTLDFDIISN